MSDDGSVQGNAHPDVRGLRDRFPGYFPPNDDQVKNFITHGLVAFDANALLDIYRLNDLARREYLAAINQLKDRFWVPNRAAHEFLENRLKVIEECSQAIGQLSADLGEIFDSADRTLRAFGNRRGLTNEQIKSLITRAGEAFREVDRMAAAFYPFDLKTDTSIKSDPILQEVDVLLNNKVGPPLTEPGKAEAEALKRLEEGRPPGYKDWKKEKIRAIGDCLLWFQMIHEASLRKLPVILVTNDAKEDWIRKDLGRTIGPRPELVAEMLGKSGMPFHLMSVQSFLLHAKKYLGVAISDDTVSQAAHLKKEHGPKHSTEIGASWREYEAAFMAAVEEVLQELGIEHDLASVSDSGLDFIIEANSLSIGVKVKFRRMESKLPSHLVREALGSLQLDTSVSGILLASNMALTKQAGETMLATSGLIHFVQWRSTEDNIALNRALRILTSNE